MLEKIKSLGNKFYWIAVFVLGGLLALIMIAVHKGFNFLKWVSDLRSSSQKESEEIRKAREEELEKKKKAEELHQRRMKAIEEDYLKSKEEFDEKKKKQVEHILKTTDGNPQKLSEELSKITGFRVILPED